MYLPSGSSGTNSDKWSKPKSTGGWISFSVNLWYSLIIGLNNNPNVLYDSASAA